MNGCEHQRAYYKDYLVGGPLERRCQDCNELLPPKPTIADLEYQLEEVQEKLKAVEDRLRKPDKLLHRYSKDGIHFCLEECGACQVLTLFGGSVGRR